MTRSVLVTGGNRGIGLAIAREFASLGDKVAVTYRSGTPADAAGSGCLAVRCDVTDNAAVEQAFRQVEEAHGPVEVLVANAGIVRDQLVVQMPDEDFHAVLDTNLYGAFRVVRSAARSMLSARSGRIILISSVVALRGSPGQVNYGASKAAMIGFARSFAREMGPRGITCNVVAPGFIDTDMTRALSAKKSDSMLAQVPLGRCGQPAEVAAAVRFLASAEAAYITGIVIPVDGGMSMGM